MKKINRKPKDDNLAPFFILGLLGVLATIFLSMMTADVYEKAESAKLEAAEVNRRLSDMVRNADDNNVCPMQLDVRLALIENALRRGVR